MTVRTDVAFPPIEGVTIVGLRLAVRPLPEIVVPSPVARSKPFKLATVIVVVAYDP